jgi:hypothetical protein
MILLGARAKYFCSQMGCSTNPSIYLRKLILDTLEFFQTYMSWSGICGMRGKTMMFMLHDKREETSMCVQVL